MVMHTFLFGCPRKSDPDVGLVAGYASPGVGTRRARRAARRVLIVEDEALIAGLIESILSAAGWSVVGPVATLERALEAIERGRLDAAVLDVRVNGHDTYAVADVLMRRGISFIFVSGFTRKQMPPGYRDCAYIAKPFTPDSILARWRRPWAGKGASRTASGGAQFRPVADRLIRHGADGRRRAVNGQRFTRSPYSRISNSSSHLTKQCAAAWASSRLFACSILCKTSSR